MQGQIRRRFAAEPEANFGECRKLVAVARMVSTDLAQRLPADIYPAVQMIDNTERCARLGILYQQDGVWHLTARLWEKPNDPAVRALAWSLWEALK